MSEAKPAVPTSPYKSARGVKRVVNAFFYSCAGLSAALRYEQAFRIDVLLALVLLPSAWLLPVGGVGKALMISSVLLVLLAELVNSAIEAVTDRISFERHELAKRAKDMGSAVVLIALLNVPVVWYLVIFG